MSETAGALSRLILPSQQSPKKPDDFYQSMTASSFMARAQQAAVA